MPADLASQSDANTQALVESYMNTNPHASREEAIKAVKGASKLYAKLDTIVDPVVTSDTTVKTRRSRGPVDDADAQRRALKK